MRRGAKPLSVDPGFVAAEARKADERRARFAALESAPAPPILKKTVAWPGGKILTPNKAEAISSFLERKKGDLSPEHEQALRGHLDRAAFSTSEVRVGPGALAGLTLAMSAGGDESGTSQADLARSIREAGGIVSNTVHKNVHLLIASDRAVKRNTQAVRKARDKFSIPIVSAAFVQDSIAAGSRRDHAAYLLGSASKALPTSAAAAAPAAASPSDVPPPRAIAARAAASGSSVMELDDGSESDADEAGAGGGGKGGVGVASSRPREGSGIADAKSGFGDPDGDEDDQEDEDEDERPPARRAEVAAGGGRTPTDEAARRASLGPTLRESPARPVRRSLVAQAMALAGTKAGVRKFKLLENRLHRLRHLRWPRIETSIERACLVGSVAEFKRAVRAMRPEGGARGGGTGRGAAAATACAGACACCPRPQMKLKKRPPASVCSPCEY